MKTIYVSAVMGLVFSGVALSEGGGNEDWAEKAAVAYEEKAAKATADGNESDAAIYLRMAQIKRDAGAASKAGKEFSWDEYHALNGQLGGGKKNDEKKGAGNEKHHHKKSEVNKKVKGKPGDGFIATAQEYQKMSMKAAEAGEMEKASVYAELAKLKLDAAFAANQGQDYDWSRYYELKKKLDE